MERKSFADMDCSVAQCLEVVGEWWSMLIVRDAFLGVTRFDDFQQRLGISRNILQQRLTRLVEAGVLRPGALLRASAARRLPADRQGPGPVAGAHRHAPVGRPYAAPDGPPLEVTHKACGSSADAVLVCGSCREEIGARDVRATVGPGRRTGTLLPERTSST